MSLIFTANVKHVANKGYLKHEWGFVFWKQLKSFIRKGDCDYEICMSGMWLCS